ncbi:MAG: MerR family transcriptional regulator [Ignavibacteria bacterium]|nr:MerR family transcriptional regulator [Ignavibacteria bacterium]
MDKILTTKEVAHLAGVHKDTLLRWLRDQRVPEPKRNRNGWRLFSEDEAKIIVSYARGNQQPLGVRENRAAFERWEIALERLKTMDWNFEGIGTGYLTHSLHPYPAKFIPQIPNTLIQELSSIGETVLDPFCGSGTTLVEALLLKRNAIGIDANPLACLISRAKTSILNDSEIESLGRLRENLSIIADSPRISGALSLFPSKIEEDLESQKPDSDAIAFWFDPHVIEELALLKASCHQLNSERARDVALTVFSSIVVTVSRQDSDTRYVRRNKQIGRGETIRRFIRALADAIERLKNLADLVGIPSKCKVIHGNILEPLNLETVDLAVSSPPYPNAFSYHLYHRNRMLWLGMDWEAFKRVEIGS